MNYQPTTLKETALEDATWLEKLNQADFNLANTKYKSGVPNEYLLKFADQDAWTYTRPEEILQSKYSSAVKNFVLNGLLVKTQKPNLIFEQARRKLSSTGYFAFRVVTAENKKIRMQQQLHPLAFKLYYPFYFLFRRVLPKVKAFRKITALLPMPVDMSKSELIGRLIFKGFTVVDLVEAELETLFIAQINLARNPSEFTPEPCEGMLFKMNRLGVNGKKVVFYKFRSMHPYAEYVQDYLLKTTGLDVGGKFKNDFRISAGGRLMRKYWIDELPMLYNLLRGDIKLVGVRPISEYYFSLYPTEVQAIRAGHKPGLFPPFYADMPGSFEEIVASEVRYLKSYEKAPLRTDFSYFIKILKNIIFKQARSK